MKDASTDSNRAVKWIWLVAIASILVVLVAILLPKAAPNLSDAAGRNSSANGSAAFGNSSASRATLTGRPRLPNEPVLTAAQIVERKLIQFAKGRRDLTHALAKRFNVTVPDEVERFFDAVAGGRWEEIDAAHKALLAPGQGLNQPRSAELHQIWRSIQEIWGVAREAHEWPPQQLLDYGEKVLGSLRPDMIYIGGTDPGCFIPTFLNETSDGERHVTLTQNALADGTYLDYLNFLYNDRVSTLSHDDSQRAFQDYVADAQARLKHDQDFPDEPKQIRPGEDVQMVDGRVQVSGQVAVMSINERLLKMFMEKNPDASFAMEESFPFKSMYADAAPLGPLMELHVQDPQNTLTADRAAESVGYWRSVSDQLLADVESPVDSNARRTYSKMIASQAALLQDRNFISEAEQIFHIANDVCPSSPDTVFPYVNLLLAQKRVDEAIDVVGKAMKLAPRDLQYSDLLNRLQQFKK
jgi:hypothetical protein